MKLYRHVFLTAFTALSFVAFPVTGNSQSLNDVFQPDSKGNTKKDETPEKGYDAPVPKVFSSKLKSTRQAENADYIFYNLKKTLWNVMQINVTHQARLLELIGAETFQTTRYKNEFSRDMELSMSDLNETYNAFKGEVDKAKESALLIREGISEDEQKKFDNLWTQNLGGLETTAEQLFKKQNDFLNTYKSLIIFILKESGQYYYDSARRAVLFTNMGSYRTFGETVENLIKVNREQRDLLLTVAPNAADQNKP